MKKNLFILAIGWQLLTISFYTQAQYTVLHKFNGKDGTNPEGHLILSGNRFYGTTFWGGDYKRGTIFSIDTTGSDFKVLHNFDSADGSFLQYSLAITGNSIYGMTQSGGTKDSGTVFTMHTDGTGFKTLHEFTGTKEDGCTPLDILVVSGNILYGTTGGGGKYENGCIFSMDNTGTNYKILYCFNGSDGSGPQGSLVLLDNVFYGTTSQGGANGVGTIFSVHTDGSGFKLMHSFDSKDGAIPCGALTLSSNVLYGMTRNGGINSDGNIFSINIDGSGYKDLLDFDGKNGLSPGGDLTVSGNILYGVTGRGGIANDGNIFSIHTDGTEFKDLFEFDGISGQYPFWAAVTLSGNMLYGSTDDGAIFNGVYRDGDGVLFSFKLPSIYKNEADMQKAGLADIRKGLKKNTKIENGWDAWCVAANYCIKHNINLKEAEKWLDTSISIKKNFSNLTIEAELLDKMKQAKKSDELLQQAVGIANENQLNNYGYQLMGSNNLSMALKVFQANAKKYPASWNVYDSLGEAYAKSGDKKQAIENYQTALSKAPDAQKPRIQNILKILEA